MSDERTDGGGVTRLSFIKRSAGVAAGAAAIGVPAAAAIADSGKPVGKPSNRTPKEPVVAYVRDADRGEVTVLAGTTETTYRDPSLVKRLLSAAPKGTVQNGAGINVIAP